MSSNDSNEIPFRPAGASVPGGLLSGAENQTYEIPQHRPAMADNPSDRLISAIRGGDLETVKSLLDVYSQPRTKLRSQPYNFLCESLQNEKEDIAKLLLERDAEINATKNGLKTPLHHAAEKGYDEVVSMLPKKDAPVNAKDDRNETSLHHAVERGNLKITELLLNKMADIKAKTKDGMTPLHLAVKLLSRAQTSEDNLDHTLASSCKLCASNLKVTMDMTDAPTTDTSLEEVAKLLLDRGADVDALNNDGKTVLRIAVEQCNFRIIERILLSRPAVKNKVNEHCLRIALKSADLEFREIVELLVAYGFTLKRRDAKHHGLLHNAVRNGHTKIVDDLLKLGANVEATHKIANGGTLLHSAAASGRIRIAELLVERGADVNAKDKKDKSPILYAVENMDPDMTNLLLTNGANSEGSPSLLHTAAERGCSHVMEMILDKIPNIDVNAVDNVVSTKLRFVDIDRSFRSAGPSEEMDTGGRDRRRRKSRVSVGEHREDAERNYELTALHVAAAGGFARVVELLLERNANVDSFAEKVGTPLHCSVIQRDEAIVEMLLLRGAEVNAKRGDGTTPLHLAVREGNAKAFELLIKHGADVHERNNRGLNSVHMAIQDGHLKMFEEHLLDVFKAGHPRTKDGLTALHIAVGTGTLADVEILLRHGADASVGDKNGETPLHYAAICDFEGRVVETLLNSHVDIDARNADGNTALHEAANEKNLAAVRLLLSHGSDVNIKAKLSNTPLDIVSRGTTYFRYHCIGENRAPLEEFMTDSSSDDDSSDDSLRQKIAENDRHVARLAVTIEEHIVKMMALGLYVNRNNMGFIDVSSLHKSIYDRCKEEVGRMKRTKIGESKVSFYDFLTTGKCELALYSRNRNIAVVLEKGDHSCTFKLYCDMIDWRFRKTKIVNDLIDSSARSLKALTGYSLSDYDYMEILGYLDRRDLENVIKAGASDEKPKNEEISNSSLEH